MSKAPLKLAVLVSGSGTTLQNLLDVTAAGAFDARVEIVIGSRPGILGLRRAADAKVMNFLVDRAAHADVAAFSKQVFSLCDDAAADLVCLGGWLSLLDVPARYAGRVMNIHPALLPSFGGRGMYGRKVHQAVLEHGCKVSGCTVHFVDERYDTGRIIAQACVPVKDDDTPESLSERVQAQEHRLYPQCIEWVIQDRLRIEGRRVKLKE